MKRLFFISLSVFFALSISAQSAREEINQNVNLAGSNYLAYPAPKKALTPAPKGEKPFYISHYGRHGSRYLIDPKDYTKVRDILQTADEKEKLTPAGKEVLRKVKLMDEESRNRYGELTELGAQQHKDIARRMYERFPEVFRGEVHVDAKSTVVIRCILSMENALQELLLHNPKLQITHDASEHDMYYMNFNDKQTTRNRFNETTQAFRENWDNNNLKPAKVMSRIFNDREYSELNVNERDLYVKLFNLAVAVQNSEIRHEISLMDIFDKDEIYTLWKRHNIGWFMEYGPCEMNGATQPFSQRNLLHKIISEADSCMQYEHPGATLRFGHETMVMPLACLLNLNGYGNPLMPNNLEENNWVNYRIFPMGANIQFIFYRRNAKDKDVLVKVLLNEEETTLPLTPVSGPYYRWNDVREYYLNKLATYEGTLAE